MYSSSSSRARVTDRAMVQIVVRSMCRPSRRRGPCLWLCICCCCRASTQAEAAAGEGVGNAAAGAAVGGGFLGSAWYDCLPGQPGCRWPCIIAVGGSILGVVQAVQ